MLADRECDISDVLASCSEQNTYDWIIRGGRDRILAKQSARDSSVRVRDELSDQPELFRKELSIRARHSWGSATLKKKQRPGKADRDARDVMVAIHAGKVTLNDPRPCRNDGMTLNAVFVREVDTAQRRTHRMAAADKPPH